MNGLPDQSWHAEAIRLRDLGLTQEAIAFEVGRSVQTVRKLLVPSEREAVRRRERARARERYLRRMKNPAFREKEAARNRERWARKKGEKTWTAYTNPSRSPSGESFISSAPT